MVAKDGLLFADLNLRQNEPWVQMLSKKSHAEQSIRPSQGDRGDNGMGFLIIKPLNGR